MKGKGGAYSACSESNRKNAVNASRPCSRIRYQYGDYFGVVNTSGSTGEHGETGMGPCWIWDHCNSDNGIGYRNKNSVRDGQETQAVALHCLGCSVLANTFHVDGSVFWRTVQWDRRDRNDHFFRKRCCLHGRAEK